MDARRAVGVRGVMTANAFVFNLAPADMERIRPFSEALVRELADAAREHARSEGYRFVGPVEVELHEDPSLTPGIFLVSSELKEAAGGVTVGALVLADGERVSVADKPLSIGRLAECDVVLADDSVSRRHAEVRRQGNEIVVVDLGSTNGTKVNGERVTERILDDGDVVTVGNASVRFEAS